MSAPASVLVGPHEFRILLDVHEINAASVEEKEQLAGQVKFNDLQIAIDPRQADTQIEETVLHEVMHAAFWFCRLNEWLKYEDEERIIDSVSAVLLMILKDNPQLVSYLTGRKVK